MSYAENQKNTHPVKTGTHVRLPFAGNWRNEQNEPFRLEQFMPRWTDWKTRGTSSLTNVNLVPIVKAGPGEYFASNHRVSPHFARHLSV